MSVIINRADESSRIEPSSERSRKKNRTEPRRVDDSRTPPPPPPELLLPLPREVIGTQQKNDKIRPMRARDRGAQQ